MVPLGIETASQVRQDYSDAALNQARLIAGVAEERLSDKSEVTGLAGDLRRLAGAGEGIVLLNSAGDPIDRAGISVPIGPREAASTRPGVFNVKASGETMLLAVMPIREGSTRKGVVVLGRPTEPLEGRIHLLWLTLAGIAVLAAALSVLLASWLSRWVSRPLRRLEEAARYVGAGDLEARSGIVDGPPEVRRLAVSFDVMAARLSTLLDRHRAVIADVSHQLRTPMSALRLRLELLTQETPHNRAELLGAIMELNRLSRLVDGLLAVARAESTTDKPISVETRAVITERVEAWAPLAAEAGVELVLLPGPDVPTWAVPEHLRQVLDNLLGNCFDLEPPPRHVRIHLMADGDTAIITVTDDGPGMTPQQRERAFQRFTTNHADTGGTGLGLAIVDRLVTAGHGTIELAETPGGGLTVAFSLPRSPRSRDTHKGRTGSVQRERTAEST